MFGVCQCKTKMSVRILFVLFATFARSMSESSELFPGKRRFFFPLKVEGWLVLRVSNRNKARMEDNFIASFWENTSFLYSCHMEKLSSHSTCAVWPARVEICYCINSVR